MREPVAGEKAKCTSILSREPDGRVSLGKNLINGEERFITIPRFCTFNPVADDMAFCHPSVQRKDGKLRIVDAENAWFVRVDSVTGYGDDPKLEKATINATSPLLFLNIETTPDSTALIWDHIEDEPGKRCPNPRVVLPRSSVENVVDKPVSVDIRSFGLRSPRLFKRGTKLRNPWNVPHPAPHPGLALEAGLTPWFQQSQYC